MGKIVSKAAFNVFLIILIALSVFQTSSQKDVQAVEGELQLNLQQATSEIKTPGGGARIHVNTTVGTAVNDYVYFAKIGNTGPSRHVKVTMYNAYGETSGYFYYVFEGYAASQSGTDTSANKWLQMPLQGGNGSSQLFAVDTRVSSANADIDLRVRRLTSTAGATTAVGIDIEASGTITRVTSSNTGNASTSGQSAPTIGGFLGSLGYQFPTSTNYFAASSNGLFISGAGDVGIGTSTPNKPLHISSSNAQPIKIEGSSPTVFFSDVDVVDTQWQIRNTDGRLDFQTQNDAGSSASNKASITNNGDLGIGTTAPAARLQIGGALAAWSTSNWGKAIQLPNATAIKWLANAGSWRHMIGQTTGGLYIGKGQCDDNSCAPSYNIFSGDNGNVGIGETVPVQKLDVNGSIYSSGSHIINYNNPTIVLQDTDHRSAFIHNNSNQFYILRGTGTNADTYTALNGIWPMQIDLETNRMTIGGNIGVSTPAIAGAGALIFKNNAATPAYNNANIQVMTNDGTDPSIGFHKSGIDAVTLYHESSAYSGADSALRIKDNSNGDDWGIARNITTKVQRTTDTADQDTTAVPNVVWQSQMTGSSDRASYWDGSTAIYTRYTGWYLITANISVALTNASDNRAVRIMENGTTRIGHGQDRTSSMTGGTNMVVTAVVYATAGNYYQVGWLCGTSCRLAPVGNGSAPTNFSVTYLGD